MFSITKKCLGFKIYEAYPILLGLYILFISIWATYKPIEAVFHIVTTFMFSSSNGNPWQMRESILLPDFRDWFFELLQALYLNAVLFIFLIKWVFFYIFSSVIWNYLNIRWGSPSLLQLAWEEKSLILHLYTRKKSH